MEAVLQTGEWIEKVQSDRTPTHQALSKLPKTSKQLEHNEQIAVEKLWHWNFVISKRKYISKLLQLG